MSHEQPESPEQRLPLPTDAVPEAVKPTVRLSQSGKLRIHDVTGKAGRSITIVGVDLPEENSPQ